MSFRTPTFAALLAFALPLAAQHVRDPRASLADIPAQQKLFAAHPSLLADIKLGSCLKLPAVEAPHGRMLIPHHYLTGSSGPTDPAEKEATRVYGDFARRINAGMNQYVATGSHTEAACALAQLDSWAQAGAMLDYDPKESSQAWYQTEWTLSSAGVTFSALVTDTTLDAAQEKRVIAWLQKAVTRNISFERPGHDNNNHHYWRALAAISIAVPASDDKLFRFAVDTYKEAIAEIDARGAFPKEMARHENATHYQAFALAPLVLVAQFASRQGLDLYTYSANGHTLRDAVVFFGHAAVDPSLVKPYTADVQRLGFGAGDFTAFAFFVSRFGAEGLPANIAASATQPANYGNLGGNVILFTLHEHP